MDSVALEVSGKTSEPVLGAHQGGQALPKPYCVSSGLGVLLLLSHLQAPLPLETRHRKIISKRSLAFNSELNGMVGSDGPHLGHMPFLQLRGKRGRSCVTSWATKEACLPLNLRFLPPVGECLDAGWPQVTNIYHVL